MKVYRVLSAALFWAGLFFSVLEVVYGYFFGVWRELGLAMGGFKDAWIQMSKVGETMLFGFLALACLLASLAASKMSAPTG